MKKASLEQELLGVTKRQQKNEKFIAATMQAVKKTEAVGTFEQALRTTGTTKQESLLMKLKRLPRFALVGVSAIGLTLVSGTAYAAYRLWASPSAQVNGNVINIQDCREAGDNNLVYVDAASANTPEQTASILKAHCEISNIQQWAMRELKVQSSDIMLPYTIVAIDGDVVTVRGDDNNTRTFSTTQATMFIADGGVVAADQLKVGQGIAYVATNDNGSARAIIALDLPLEYYQASAQRLVVTQDTCGGNPGELCRQGGGITGVRVDTNGEAASSQLADGWELKTIEGNLVSYASNSITLKSSSGAQYTVQTPHNLIDRFNADASRNRGLNIVPGDTLSLQYRQPKGADKYLIAANEFEEMTLVVKGDAKAGNLQKY